MALLAFCPEFLFGVFHDRSSDFFSCGFKFVWQQSDNRF